MNLLLEVSFDSISRRKDKSFKFGFVSSMEITEGQAIADYYSLLDQTGTLLFSLNGVNQEQKEAVKTFSKEEKQPIKKELSKSQLLRLALKSDFESQNKNATKEESEEYYNKEMARFIREVRDRNFQ